MNVAALPKDEALNGTWTRPALKALNESGQWAQEVHAYLRLSGSARTLLRPFVDSADTEKMK